MRLRKNTETQKTWIVSRKRLTRWGHFIMGKKGITYLVACLNYFNVLIITDRHFPHQRYITFKKKIPTSFWVKQQHCKVTVESEMCQSGKILWKWQSPCTTFWLPVSTTTVMRSTVGKPKEETSAGSSRGKCLTLTSVIAVSPFCRRNLSLIFNSCLLLRTPKHTHKDKHSKYSLSDWCCIIFLCPHKHKQQTRTHFNQPKGYCTSVQFCWNRKEKSSFYC